MNWDNELDQTHPHRQRVFIEREGCCVNVRSMAAITPESALDVALAYLESLHSATRRRARGKTVTILYENIVSQRLHARQVSGKAAPDTR
ncbi:MAG: hypothetical protein J0L84_09630 [Verrucomicrobia bacterium]|nr:hypothetical protein [Verrucomicrobiota bacterium]